MALKRILIEGPDCSGKTTLVEALKNVLEWDAKSLHHKEGRQFERYLKEYALSEKTIFNRGHISEIVYSKLWARKTPFTDLEKKMLGELFGVDAIIIFACPKIEEMKKRYWAREYDQKIQFIELEKCRDLFIDEFKTVPTLIYESKDRDELRALVERIKIVENQP